MDDSDFLEFYRFIMSDGRPSTFEIPNPDNDLTAMLVGISLVIIVLGVYLAWLRYKLRK